MDQGGLVIYITDIAQGLIVHQAILFLLDVTCSNMALLGLLLLGSAFFQLSAELVIVAPELLVLDRQCLEGCLGRCLKKFDTVQFNPGGVGRLGLEGQLLVGFLHLLDVVDRLTQDISLVLFVVGDQGRDFVNAGVNVLSAAALDLFVVVATKLVPLL